jgi:hypothetical protein
VETTKKKLYNFVVLWLLLVTWIFPLVFIYIYIFVYIWSSAWPDEIMVMSELL